MNFELSYISPELILALGAMLTLFVGLGVRKWGTIGLVSPESISLGTLVAALIPSIIMLRMGERTTQFGDTFAVDGLAAFFKIIAIVSTMLVILLAVDFFRQTDFHRGEFYSLLVFATLAITSLAASNDLIMIYLSIEFLSITSYILAGYLKNDPKSSEASIKYFLYGSIAAAIMIYGMSMLYGLTGTTNLPAIAEFLSRRAVDPTAHNALLFLSAVMVLAGFGFKVAMVPFHQWSPDTYEGAPTPVTAFLSVGSKAAGIAVLVRFFSAGLTHSVLDWVPLLAALSAITMTVGNLIAIQQTNMKRMLAYSSIAHAGYLMIGICAMPYTRYAVPSILLYTAAYLFMNLGAFAIVTMLGRRLHSDEIKSYSGLIKRSPVLAFTMVFFLLSLAGIPPTAGFLGKFYLFAAALGARNAICFWLAIAAIINTVISVYYYMNVVRQMFFVEPEHSARIAVTPPIAVAVGITFVVTLVMLIYPQPFIDIASRSAWLIGI